jgi:HNH endonuclease
VLDALIFQLPERVSRFIQVADQPHPALGTPCWCWTGRLNRNGYARFCWEGRQPVGHRVLYEKFIGPIPPKLILDHRCRNRKCVNPWHTEPVTVKVNTERGEAVLFKRAA